MMDMKRRPLAMGRQFAPEGQYRSAIPHYTADGEDLTGMPVLEDESVSRRIERQRGHVCSDEFRPVGLASWIPLESSFAGFSDRFGSLVGV
jgi:hypothetical protein